MHSLKWRFYNERLRATFGCESIRKIAQSLVKLCATVHENLSQNSSSHCRFLHQPVVLKGSSKGGGARPHGSSLPNEKFLVDNLDENLAIICWWPRLKMLKFLLYIYHGWWALMDIYAFLTACHLTYIYCILFLCYTYYFKWQINFSLSLLRARKLTVNTRKFLAKVNGRRLSKKNFSSVKGA